MVQSVRGIGLTFYAKKDGVKACYNFGKKDLVIGGR